MLTRYHKLFLAWLIGLSALLVLMQSASSVKAAAGTEGTPPATDTDTLGASQWVPMVNGGLNDTVLAVVAVGNELYVGGKFTGTKDGNVQGLNHIAKYSNGQWEALPNDGLDGLYVHDIVAIGSDLYVGGAFTETADGTVENLNNIAKLSNGQWSALPNKGLSGPVRDMDVKGNDLYVGGDFVYTNDYTLSLNHIAKFSGGQWSALPNKGLKNQVYALKWFKNDLYAGGNFSGTTDYSVSSYFFAKLKNGTQWVPVEGNGVNAQVLALTVYNNRLVLGGWFTATQDGTRTGLNYIANWNGNAFEALANGGLNQRVETFATYDGILYTGGGFRATADNQVRMQFIGMYRNNKWTALPNEGTNGVVTAMGVMGGSMYVGGTFSGTYDNEVTGANNIIEMNLGANLKLRQSAVSGPGAREFKVTLSVTNRGPNSAENVKVVDKVPDGYAAINATTPVGSCDIKNRKVVCTLGTLTPSQAVNMEVILRGDTGTPVVSNCAEASSTTYDPNQQNLSSCIRIPPN